MHFETTKIARRELEATRINHFEALTTTFTPPSSCNGLAVQLGAPGFDSTPFYAPYSDCYPGSSLFSFYWGTGDVNLWYTPGLFCPKGYTTAATWGGGIETEFDNPPSSGESAYLCCPL
jgi:hypothetical protein